ncbi:MAG TPA: type II toxin-antitoxin system RelE/ParE family toxin [Alphaproteobacteria bacterium]|nr:type II toxin-antitoxin system RelE/ParE family toxin [Alphaproteobacteria bacterium]
MGRLSVRWLRAALRDLDAQAPFIASDNPHAAREMISRVRSAVERLAEHPDLGRHGRVPGTRELVVPGTPYVIPYRVRGSAVEVLRLFHGAQRRPLSP